jgi:hypothetical protein
MEIARNLSEKNLGKLVRVGVVGKPRRVWEKNKWVLDIRKFACGIYFELIISVNL